MKVALSGVRRDLQAWLAVSVDELAACLDLSPTTVVNATKKGAPHHPQTVRKLKTIHGQLVELRKVMGAATAETWAKTTGRSLLLRGDIKIFEAFIDSKIWGSMRRQTPSYMFGDFEAELIVKPSDHPPAMGWCEKHGCCEKCAYEKIDARTA